MFSSHRRRVHAMKALVAGSVVAKSPQYRSIMAEYDLVAYCRRVRREERRWLLQIIHSARALDTLLAEFTKIHGCAPRGSSLGSYLKVLNKHRKTSIGRITSAERRHFQAAIVHVRNVHMHEAGAFPASNSEVSALISEMHACVQRVLGL